MGSAPREENRVPGLVAKSDADNTPVIIEADPITKRLKVNATITGSASDGSIVDGVDTGIKATVFDYANANPLGVVLRDTNGDYVSVGGGTQYTEDAAAAANPVGTAVNLIRKDTPAGEVTTDGDNIAQRGTNYGAAYVTLLDTSGTAVSVGGGTQYDEDTASADAQKLTMAGVTRADTAASQVGTDGDRSTLIVDSSGRMHVNVGVSALPTGASTSAKQDTGNTSLASIDGKITAVNTGAVVVSSSALPTGASTLAEQQTQTTALQLIDDVVYASDAAISKVAGIGAQFDDIAPGTTTENSVRSLRMSTRRELYNQIRDAAGNERGVNVTAGNALVVDGSASTQPVSGTVTANAGSGTLAVSNAGLTELAGAINASAQMDVNIAASNATLTVASHAVTNAGTFAVQVDGSALTALQLIDDTVATLGTTTYTEAATKGNIIGAIRRDADTTLVDTTNEVGPLQMDANGRLKVEAFSGEALPVTLTSTTVTGTVAVTQSGTWDEIGINDSGNSITVDNAQLSVVGSGTEATAMRVTIATDSTGLISVDDGGGSLTVDVGTALPAGTNNIGDVDIVSGTITTVSTLTGGGIAHGSADSGNPVKVGGKVETATSTATMEADGDRSDFITDADAAQIVRLNYPLGDLISERVSNTDGASTASTNFGAVASTRSIVTAISVYNSSATPGYIDFRDGTAGSVLWTMALPAGGGAVLCDPSGLFKTTANTALAYDVSAALTTVYISVSGFKSKVT